MNEILQWLSIGVLAFFIYQNNAEFRAQIARLRDKF